MHQFLRTAPAEAIPPPPQVQPPPQRAEAIKNAKEQGNVGLSWNLPLFKLNIDGAGAGVELKTAWN